MNRFFLTIFYSLFCGLLSFAQPFSGDTYLKHPADIGSYDIAIEVSDSNDVIQVEETIRFVLKESCDSFFLDLQSLNNGRGMKVNSLTIDYEFGKYRHENNRIWIQAKPSWQGLRKTMTISYSGIPETGLIIGQNKFGNRTFFGDNWPNRAHHWLACVDHPFDKATINFTVTAPKDYEVIATGVFQEQKSVPTNRTRHVYKSQIPLPTKVMVVGIANFETKQLQPSPRFPVSAWSYPEDASNTFNDMKVSLDVLNYFIEVIGEYPYEKLANVQSTTQFGGMENAGNIFYDENAVTGENSMVALVAHEVAHQWFGNSASEMDWQHIWLSEGFATYFADLFWEHTYGEEARQERMLGERNRVIRFSKSYDHPVVDENFESLMHLLNANSYQKGAWTLHMLRCKLGDDNFFKGIRIYYDKYKFANATTEDFIAIMNEVSEEDLQDFFDQWLYTPGHPVLLINSKEGRKSIELIIEQKQKGQPFTFDLEVEVVYKNGTSETQVINITEATTKFELKTSGKVSGFKYDPEVKLLFEQVEF